MIYISIYCNDYNLRLPDSDDPRASGIGSAGESSKTSRKGGRGGKTKPSAPPPTMPIRPVTAVYPAQAYFYDPDPLPIKGFEGERVAAKAPKKVE